MERIENKQRVKRFELRGTQKAIHQNETQIILHILYIHFITARATTVYTKNIILIVKQSNITPITFHAKHFWKLYSWRAPTYLFPIEQRRQLFLRQHAHLRVPLFLCQQ